MDLDIIIPLYNEEKNIIPMYNEIKKNLKKIKYNVIFVDDGSIDNSLKKIKEIYEEENNIKIVSFSRNFGKDAAIFAGIIHSSSKYCCIIDADLQQDPKYILEMYNFIIENKQYDEVAMVNNYKNLNEINRFLKNSFYKIMNRLVEQRYEIGASDFRLFNSKVRDSILKLCEKNRFSKGIFSWIGFNVYYMKYNAKERKYGNSKFNLKKQFKYAKDGIVSFTTKPLKIATILGSIISIIAFIYTFIILLQTIIFGKDIPGYASIMCVVLFLGGIQLLILGIIGEYISKVYFEVKNRPIYIEKEYLEKNK